MMDPPPAKPEKTRDSGNKSSSSTPSALASIKGGEANKHQEHGGVKDDVMDLSTLARQNMIINIRQVLVFPEEPDSPSLKRKAGQDAKNVRFREPDEEDKQEEVSEDGSH